MTRGVLLAMVEASGRGPIARRPGAGRTAGARAFGVVLGESRGRGSGAPLRLGAGGRAHRRGLAGECWALRGPCSGFPERRGLATSREKDERADMIEFGIVGLMLSLPVARALFEFASEDKERWHLGGIGIDEGNPCATDGHTAVRFTRDAVAEGAVTPTSWNGKYWRRENVADAIKGASRSGNVLLEWTELERGEHLFPKISKVEPKQAPGWVEPVQLDARYLARLELVAKACRRSKAEGEKEAPPLPGVLIVSMATSLDPMRFEVGGGEFGLVTAHVAYVTIMPMRKSSTSNAKVKRANKARKKQVAA